VLLRLRLNKIELEIRVFGFEKRYESGPGEGGGFGTKVGWVN
jgi:hypothetical protein